MLAVFFDMAICIACWIFCGVAARSFLGRPPAGQPHAGLSPEEPAFLGMAFLGSLAGALSLALPLGPGPLLGLLVFVALVSALPGFKKSAQADLGRMAIWWRELGALPQLVLAGGLLLLLGLASGKAVNGDSALYHAAAIRWIEDYPAVPGLANLHTRLGFNSHWFVLEALLRLPWGGGRVHAANAAAWLLGFAWSLQGLARLMGGRRDLGSCWRFFCLLLLLQIGRRAWDGPDFLAFLSSPSPDFPVMLLCWWCLGQFLEEAYGAEDALRVFSVMAACAFAVTLKMSALPLLLCAALLAWRMRAAIAPHWAGALLALGLLGLPFLARNWVLSGWILYPAAWPRLAGPDWQVPAYELKILAATIKGWAKTPFLAYPMSSAQPLADWLGPWWGRRSLFEKSELLLALLSPLSLGLAWMASGAARKQALAAAWFWAFSLAGALFWFYAAPDPRFGLGFILPMAAATFLPWVSGPASGGSGILVRLLAVVVALFFLRGAWHQRHDIDFKDQWLLPLPYPVAEGQTTQLGSVAVFQPSNNECWDRPGPCICGSCLHPRLEPRGITAAEGFRIHPPLNAVPGELDPYYSQVIPEPWR